MQKYSIEVITFMPFTESLFLQEKSTNLQSHGTVLLQTSLKLTSAEMPTNHSALISQLMYCDFCTLHLP